MSKYMIALKSGRVLNDLRLNGSMYVSKTEITMDDLPPEELEEVVITETDKEGNATVTRMKDAVCDTVKHWEEGWLFNIREKTAEEKREQEIADLQATNEMLIDCILEMSEEVYGDE